ncbi:uncharacterized protein Tco025E_01965 [Trypanosoma conorhini]|uniref:EF-hand domain-containing protein n=1 Tax=Trypanosoma conorhini TaxID=83891 RepID=A0A3R7PIH0_9TRYP|nr:uncharacterized protein Tco025E_01965 [Trypanosoma conorhini]RNF25773.1 hypothetical protein Tco025E_01965 [Trypanosoma conorhini]
MRRLARRASPALAGKKLWGTRCVSSDGDAALNQKELRQLVKVLEDDPKLLIDLVGRLDAQSRRRLVVAGGAMEWFGKESAASEVERADADKDLRISPKDFDHWIESALRRRLRGSSPQQPDNPAAAGEEMQVPFLTLVWIAFGAGLPFVGFGFLDNAIMILAGDAIDSTLGLYLNCSVMACAAMGNIFSGVLGMQVHGVIDKAVQKLNFNTPVLTEGQMKGQRVFLAGHIGGTLGIMTGLFLGMFPLLLLDSGEGKADHALFHRWDKDGNGYLEMIELKKELANLGLSESAAELLMEKYGRDGRLDFKQFQKIRNDVRKGETVFA